MLAKSNRSYCYQWISQKKETESNFSLRAHSHHKWCDRHSGVPAWSHPHETMVFYLDTVLKISPKSSTSQLLKSLSIPLFPNVLCWKHPFLFLLLGLWQSTRRGSTVISLLAAVREGTQGWRSSWSQLGWLFCPYKTGVCCCPICTLSKSTNHSPGS